MKNIVLLIALSTSILLSQNITVFGGLNESTFILMRIHSMLITKGLLGFNLGIEKKLGPLLLV